MTTRSISIRAAEIHERIPVAIAGTVPVGLIAASAFGADLRARSLRVGGVGKGDRTASDA